MEPIVAQLDPTMIHWSSTLLNVAIEYGDRLLSMRENPDHHGAGLPQALVEMYPTHGFSITRDEAKDTLRLPIHNMTDYEYSKYAMQSHRAFERGRRNIVNFVALD